MTSAWGFSRKVAGLMTGSMVWPTTSPLGAGSGPPCVREYVRDIKDAEPRDPPHQEPTHRPEVALRMRNCPPSENWSHRRGQGHSAPGTRLRWSGRAHAIRAPHGRTLQTRSRSARGLKTKSPPPDQFPERFGYGGDFRQYGMWVPGHHSA